MIWDRAAGVLPATHRRLSAEEYFKLPEGPPYFQLIDGELLKSPTPDFLHQQIVLSLAFVLHEYLLSHPIGRVVIAPSDVHFDEGNVFQPDVYYICNKRSDLIDEQGLKGAPDLIAEVISGSTARLDLGPKQEIYAAHGVKELWVVYPKINEVAVYRLTESVATPTARLTLADVLTSELLPQLEIPLAKIFVR